MVRHRFCFIIERIGRNCLFAAGLGVDSQAHPRSANHVRHVEPVQAGASPV
jgi:hypothetical protein